MLSGKLVGRDKGRAWVLGARSKNIGRKAKNPFGYSKYMTTIASPLTAKQVVPPVLYMQHRYCADLELYTDNTTGLSSSIHRFALNDIYAPDKTVTGHQPLGRDQMAALYAHYHVYKVDICIRVTLVEDQTLFAAARVANSETYLAWAPSFKYPRELRERPEVVCIGGNVMGAGDTWQTTLYNADIEGIPRAQYNNDISFGANNTASPVKSQYLDIVSGSFNLGTSKKCTIAVNLVYHTAWKKPLTLGES